MGKCPQPVTDSSQPTTDSSKKTDSSVDTTGLTIRQGYSFRVIPVDDIPKTYIKTVSKELQPEVKIGGKPEVIPITTKKPVKL